LNPFSFILLSYFLLNQSCGAPTLTSLWKGQQTIAGINLPASKPESLAQDSIKGDFNGDGKMEYAWIESFKTNDSGKCRTGCKIKFSDKNLPDINLGYDIYGGHLINQGDLNDKAGDEFSVVPYGDASEWSFCAVYSFNKNKWVQIVKPFNVYGSHGNYVKKHPGKKGYLIITEFLQDHGKSISPKDSTVRCLP